ncbi:MAG: TonB-dependent receptor [Pseudomonadota bacterium]
MSCSAVAVCSGSSYAAEPDPPQDATQASPQPLFVHLSLEELGNIQVSSVSKKKERLADTAASIYVITDEAIRRSGARSIPEALALAPNLLVAQINANQYAISARGFNSSTANKLLVMIDGRTVYTPLYSGVFWDAQDVVLLDVARIEVLSGSGGSLWGANAVNGVINIITKRATETMDDLLNVSVGNTGQIAAFHHGAAFNDNGGAYRVYAKLAQGRHTVRANGAPVPDGWDRAQLGFRSDWHRGANELTLQGDTYRGTSEQQLPGQATISGSNVLVRWSQLAPDGSGFRLQTYLDHASRDAPGLFSDKLTTLDLDLQYSFAETEGRSLIWGAGYRVSDDEVGNSASLAFLPARRKLHNANLFVQHEQNLSPELRFTAGAKLESNHYTGLEFLPNLKLAWKPAEDRLIWASWSRAVRAPSRIDSEIYIPGKPPYQLAGGSGFRSEIANTLELGMRARHTENLSTTLVGFHSKYDHLRSLDKLASGVYVIGNRISGTVQGLEASMAYQVSRSWSISANALFLHESFCGPSLAQSRPGNDPKLQYSLSTKWDLNERMQADLSLRHMDSLAYPFVPAANLLDARYGWRILNNLELSISGKNLLNARYQAFASGSSNVTVNPILLERSYKLSIMLRF